MYFIEFAFGNHIGYRSPSPSFASGSASSSGLVALRGSKRPVVEVDDSDAYHRSSNLSRHATDNFRSISHASSSAPTSSSGNGTRTAVITRLDRYCAASANGTTTGPNDRTFRRCSAVGWTPSHQCSTATRSSAVSDNANGLTFGAMTRVQDVASASTSSPSFSDTVRARSAASSPVVPVANTTRAELQAAYNAGGAHATAEIADLHIFDNDVDMVDHQAQQCKYHHVFSLLPENESNVIITPITIESIKTYAIVDTGATFSMVSPEFASFLGNSVKITPTTGSIKLGHSDTTISRTSSTILNILYNKKKLEHKFEVFSFYKSNNNNSIPALIGLDVISKLNIGITGLALSHTALEADSLFSKSLVDPSTSERYGTIEMGKLLELALLANENIDVRNTYCTLPGAIVYLKTKSGCIIIKSII
ncbi:hypothetical protein MFLAVUS_006137 [Mucor flavus]|uniref:Uncharacterized protein n=1 Tax=Mucor flavus TaxID=439312 RepID=A0ABP9Z0P6_9FUNG